MQGGSYFSQSGWLLKGLNKTFAQLELKFQREPSSDERAEVLQIDPNEIADTIKMDARQVSVNAPFFAVGREWFGRCIGDENGATPDANSMEDSSQKGIKRSPSKLLGKKADIISLYFCLNGEAPTRSDDIGQIYEITRWRIRQIKKKVRRLRTGNRSRALGPI